MAETLRELGPCQVVTDDRILFVDNGCSNSYIDHEILFPERIIL